MALSGEVARPSWSLGARSRLTGAATRGRRRKTGPPGYMEQAMVRSTTIRLTVLLLAVVAVALLAAAPPRTQAPTFGQSVREPMTITAPSGRHD